MTKQYTILFVARDDGGCGFFRCLQPATFLKRSGLADAVYVLRNPSQEQLMNADLVILQENGSPESSAMVKFMTENRIPFMFELDDFVHHISPHNEAGYMAWNPSTLFLYRTTENMRKAVGMTLSTNQLAREYFPYNPNIFVVPNYLDKDKWDNPIIKRQDEKIRIGWCGGNAHADDLKMISKVLNKIIKEYKGTVIFETIGMTRKEFTGVFPMAPTNPESICPSCGYEGELHHFPGESLDDYPTVLCSKGWDIAVAPVIDNSFGNCKSDLKVKEYAAAGIPIVASPVVPYREASENGAQIIFAKTFDEWYTALKDLIEDKIKRDSIIQHNRDWVSKYWIQDNISNIYEVYSQVIRSVIPFLGSKEDRLKGKNLVK